MNKVVMDGKVAVLYSPDYGAGWSSWNTQYEEELIFEPFVVEMLMTINADTEEWVDKTEMYLKLKYPDMYIGDLTMLRIKWVPEGKEFRITEYDGNETVEIADEQFWFVA